MTEWQAWPLALRAISLVGVILFVPLLVGFTTMVGAWLADRLGFAPRGWGE